MPAARRIRVEHWTAETYKPPFSDAQTPLQYRLDGCRSQHISRATTGRGYRQIIATERRTLTTNGGRIVHETVARSGATFIYYRIDTPYEHGILLAAVIYSFDAAPRVN